VPVSSRALHRRAWRWKSPGDPESRCRGVFLRHVSRGSASLSGSSVVGKGPAWALWSRAQPFEEVDGASWSSLKNLITVFGLRFGRQSLAPDPGSDRRAGQGSDRWPPIGWRRGALSSHLSVEGCRLLGFFAGRSFGAKLYPFLQPDESDEKLKSL